MLMIINPCFECLCNPICRNKKWYDCFDGCQLIMFYYYEMVKNKKISSHELINLIKSKKFFEMQTICTSIEQSALQIVK